MQSRPHGLWPGVVARYQDPIATMRCTGFGERKFVLLDNTECGLLNDVDRVIGVEGLPLPDRYWYCI